MKDSRRLNVGMDRRWLGALMSAACLTGAAAARAQPDVGGNDLVLAADSALRLDLGAAREMEVQPEGGGQSQPGDGRAPQRPDAYLRAGSQWWTIGVLWANDFKDANDFNLHVAYSVFLADRLEFAVEGAGWYFDQRGRDTGGVSASMVFRWHFWASKDQSWTVFGDAGIGLLVGFDEVPDGGTEFNFVPRVGAGFTKALDESVDGESRGARLMVGVRYHHISNARINSDRSNPARDAVAIYAAVTLPF